MINPKDIEKFQQRKQATKYQIVFINSNCNIYAIADIL